MLLVLYVTGRGRGCTSQLYCEVVVFGGAASGEGQGDLLFLIHSKYAAS